MLFKHGLAGLTNAPSASSSGPLDDFNRSDENLEASADWSGTVGYVAGNAQIVSNQCRFLGDYEVTCVQHGDTRADDHWAEVEFASVNATDTYVGGPMIRISDGASNGNGYYAEYDTANSHVRVFSVTNGSVSALQTYTSITLSAGDVLRLSASGTTITTSINGSPESPTVTDSDWSSGNAGILGYTGGGGSITWDNFDAGDV